MRQAQGRNQSIRTTNEITLHLIGRLDMKKQKNKQEKINKIVKLAFITDSGYAMPTVVAIQSAICNKKDDSIYEVIASL